MLESFDHFFLVLKKKQGLVMVSFGGRGSFFFFNWAGIGDGKFLPTFFFFWKKKRQGLVLKSFDLFFFFSFEKKEQGLVMESFVFFLFNNSYF